MPPSNITSTFDPDGVGPSSGIFAPRAKNDAIAVGWDFSPASRRVEGRQCANSGHVPNGVANGSKRPEVSSLHAPEVECIGKGKANAPYEFGCKVSIATPVTRPKGGHALTNYQRLPKRLRHPPPPPH